MFYKKAMDKEEIFDWVIEIMNEERDKNNDKANEILEKILEDANISQYEEVDTVVTIFVRVRKWSNISSSWWSYEMRITKFHDKYDINMAKICLEELCNLSLQ